MNEFDIDQLINHVNELEIENIIPKEKEFKESNNENLESLNFINDIISKVNDNLNPVSLLSSFNDILQYAGDINKKLNIKEFDPQHQLIVIITPNNKIISKEVNQKFIS